MSTLEPVEETRILVADDDPIFVALIAGWLRGADYEVTECADSASALSACIAQEPRLAIIDYEMPGYSGLDLARFMNSQTDVVLIFLSAHAEREIIDSAIAAGAFAYLVKPVDEQRLLVTVRTALERGREMRELRQRSSNLGGALQTTRMVSMATGLIMGRLRIGEQDAFSRLRQQARSNRKKLEEVAAELLHTSEESARIFGGLAQDGRQEPETPRPRRSRTPRT
jgi:response regulator NasT